MRASLTSPKQVPVLCRVVRSADMLPRSNEKPRSRIERLDNVTQALGYLERCGVQTVFLTPLQVVDGDHKYSLTLLLFSSLSLLLS
jgi:hypothetical protein